MAINKLLVNLKRSSKHALFLGAGASIESGGLSADAIADNILLEVYATSKADRARAQFQKEFNKSAIFENVIEEFSTGTSSRRNILISFLKHMEPSIGYRHLATLIKGGLLYPIIFTTNFDTMLEQAIKEESYIKTIFNIKVLTQTDIDTYNIEPALNEIIIIKLHGDINREDTLKITKTEAANITDFIKNLLYRIVEQQGLIIIGYRAKDIGIRNAIQDAPVTKKGIYWITKDCPTENNDPDMFALLNKHNSVKNILSEISFDHAFSLLGKPYISCHTRIQNRVILDDAWLKLDHVRSFGRGRQKTLKKMHEIVSQIVTDCPTSETLALREAISYERDHSGETYRLQQSVLLLEKAIEQYKSYLEPEEIISVNTAYLNELLNLFLVGNYNPNERLRHLDKLIETARTIINEIHDNDIFTRARVLTALGEACKEKAMIIQEPDNYRLVIMQAREYCDEAIAEMKGNDSPSAKYLLGSAYRHIAVTYELEADTKSGFERKKLYEEWSRYSAKAVELLEDIEEDCVRGYALMNLASSYCRLLEFEVNITKKQQYIDDGIEYLNKSINHLKKVDDNRGVGWGYLHLSELTRKKIDLAFDIPEINSLLVNLESYANKSVAALKFVDDHLASGLAYEQLGIALYYSYSKQQYFESIVKLKQAIYVLKKGTDNLLNASFYRSTGEAYFWLAKCLCELWRVSNDEDKVNYIQDAVSAITKGILITSLGMKKDLKYLYDLMMDELEKILNN